MKSLLTFLIFTTISILLPALTIAQPACNTGADQSPCDGIVSLTELQGYIQLWYGCSSCYPDLYDAIGAWYEGQEPVPVCGDGTCDAGEDCSSCPHDCGSCPAAECTTTVSDPAGLEYAKTNAQPGDVICLMNGSYGDFTDSRTATGTDWITYKAVDGEVPVLEHVEIGSGGNDAYIELDGLHVTNKLILPGRHINVKNCDVQGGNWDTEPAAIDGIWSSNPDYRSSYVLVENCSVHYAYLGIRSRGDYWTIKNNKVYHIACQAIRGGESNVLVEGNEVWDINPYYDPDYDQLPGGTKDIHSNGIFWYSADAQHNITIRNNVIHSLRNTGGGSLFISAGGGPWTNIRIENNLIHNIDGHTLLIGNNGGTMHFNNNTIIESNTEHPGYFRMYDIPTEMYNNIFSRLGIDDGPPVSHGNNIFGAVPTGFTPDASSSVLTQPEFEDLFVNYTGKDFHPLDTSIACDGIIVPMPGYVGALECVSTSIPTGCDHLVSDASELANASNNAQPGNVICLEDGDYGDFYDTRTNNGPFITYKAINKHGPVFGNFIIGDSGNDAYVELDGLHITNKLTLRGNHINIKNCEVESGDFTDSSTAIVEGVWLQCDNILVEDCDIHYGWRGIRAGGYYWTIRNNTIHHIAEDGIKGGVSDVLVEHNKVYDLSPFYHPDYRGDGTGLDIHGDGIQWYSGSVQENITIRDNNFYSSRINGGGAIFVSAGGGPWTNVRVENNLLYDIDGNILLVGCNGGTLYVNNNTILETISVVNFRVYDATEMYNNIFSKLWTNGNIAGNGNNIYAETPIGFTLGSGSQVLTQTEFEDLFVSYAGSDFHPESESIACDGSVNGQIGVAVGALPCSGEALPECTAIGQCDSLDDICNDWECNTGTRRCEVTYTTSPCDDNNECTDNDICSAGTCFGTNKADGTACPDDGLFCNGQEACQSGSCQHSGNPCTDDGFFCTTVSCSEATQCGAVQYDHSACDDGNPCTDDSCIGSGGEAGTGCSNTPNTDPCDDSNPCTSGDACSSGSCQPGSAITSCTDDDGCCPEGCDENSDNDCASIPAGYIAFWELETDATDSSPNGLDGTMEGDAAIANDAIRGNVLSVDGDGDYAVIPDNDLLDLVDEFTVLYWEKPGSYYHAGNDESRVIGKGAYQWAFGHTKPDSGGGYNALIRNSACSGWWQPTIGTAPPIGEWVQVAFRMTNSGNSMEVFENGISLGTKTQTAGICPTSTSDVFIGRRRSEPDDEYFSGSIDNVMIYDRALTAAEINQIYQAQSQ